MSACVRVCVRACVCVCVCVCVIGVVAKTSEFATGHRCISCVIVMASLDFGLRYMEIVLTMVLLCFSPWLCLGPEAGACLAYLPDCLKCIVLTQHPPSQNLCEVL